MSRDPAHILGQEAMALTDQIRRDFGADAAVGTVVIAADVIFGADDQIGNAIVFGSTDHRKWVVEALLREALDVAEIENVARHDAAADALGGDDDAED